jgi:apolipoprotein N-acyltransferase
MISRRAPLLYSLLSSILLSAAWYGHLSILIFFALVPLLLLEDNLKSRENPAPNLKLFGYAYLTFFLWNVLVTWWVVYASFGGACMAFIFNSLLMSFVFLIFSSIKRRIHKPFAIWTLIPVWIAWEHIHTLWDITWTWLTLGNVFAFNHQWVQWYEITGTSGGTLWVLAVNILVFRAIKYKTATNILSKPIGIIAASIVLPILVSYCIFFLRSSAPPKADMKRNVVVVQPNIDPYSEKFYVAYEEQFAKMLRLVKGKITASTNYLVLPETFITGLSDDLNEETINDYLEIKWFRDSLIKKFPQLKIVTGANTYRFYYDKKDFTATSRRDQRNKDIEYDVFNSAVFIDGTSCEVYHKSKLVPGVERMPFPALLKPLESMAINMGGTVGSLGIQEERAVFTDRDNKTAIAPVICYESVYADYVADYIRKGANLIFIITNDGWWDDTPGYVQHLNYARLRAIENRREIARSANTGISCFIDRFGNISNATSWWKEAVIEKTMEANDELTFFSRFGDLLSYFSVVVTILLMALALVLRWRR